LKAVFYVDGNGGNYETLMSVAIVGALATAIVAVVKAFFSKNENSQQLYDYQIKLVELVSKQSQSVDSIVGGMTRIHSRIDEVEKRLDAIEQEMKK